MVSKHRLLVVFSFLSFIRCVIQITATVDSGYETKWTETGNFSDFSSRVLYVGGALNSPDIKGSRVIQSFYGCLKGVSEWPYRCCMTLG